MFPLSALLNATNKNWTKNILPNNWPHIKIVPIVSLDINKACDGVDLSKLSNIRNELEIPCI